MTAPRPIPGFPGYTIDRKGVILRLARTENRRGISYRYAQRRVCHQRLMTGLSVTLYGPTGKAHQIMVARVLLEVWGDAPKPDSDEPLYCGRKDSDVHSLELSNLAWMTRGQIKQTANQNGKAR